MRTSRHGGTPHGPAETPAKVGGAVDDGPLPSSQLSVVLRWRRSPAVASALASCCGGVPPVNALEKAAVRVDGFYPAVVPPRRRDPPSLRRGGDGATRCCVLPERYRRWRGRGTPRSPVEMARRIWPLPPTPARRPPLPSPPARRRAASAASPSRRPVSASCCVCDVPPCRCPGLSVFPFRGVCASSVPSLFLWQGGGGAALFLIFAMLRIANIVVCVANRCSIMGRPMIC